MSIEVAVAKRSLAGIVKEFDYVAKDITKGGHLKRLKDVVRRNEGIVKDFVDALFEYFKRDDCDVRLAALLVADHFFQRSHAFRTQIVEFLQDFLLCVAETDPLRYPLPQPLDAARRLKTEALNIIKFWHDKYSPAYAKLRIANDFLKASKSFDYERTDAATRIERQRAQEERKRKEATDLRITAKVRSIVDENEPDIRKWLRETKNAIDLLYPNFATEESEPLAEDLERKDARNLHGYYAGDEIRIVIRPTDVLVKEDESNKDLFEILRDCYKMVNSYSKAVSRWLQNLHKHTTDANRDLIKLLVDMKNEIKVNLDKCKELKVDVVKRQRRAVVEGESESDYDESDDEFVDVEERKFDLKFGDSEEIPEHILDRIARIQKGEEHPEKPGPSGVQIVEDDQKPCSSKDVKPIIPTVSYGLDFKYWKDNDAKPAEIPKNVYDGMDYCKQAEADVLNEPSESVQMRVFSFVGDEHDGPKLKCRARTKNGKLCPRMDKKTCPFHGKIIPRDEEGFPKEENADAEAVEKAKERQKKEEEEFVRDIEQVTGVSLTGNRRTAKKRERTTSQVTRDRLSNKLFDKRTLKRVTDTIEAIRQAKVQKLHGHNFTHALQRK